MNRILVTSIVSGAALQCGATTLDSYHIGNSLTWNARPPAVEAIAASQGMSLNSGSHIYCGQPLHAIASNPTQTCVTNGGFGTWDQALADFDFDILTVQPHPAGTATTLQSDIDAISTFVDTALTRPGNATMQLYRTRKARPDTDLRRPVEPRHKR